MAQRWARHAVKAAVERAKLDPGEVEDVIMGCANPEGATGMNIARQIAYSAPAARSPCPGMTVNRFCSSGLQTIALAAQRVIAGEADILVAGGVESISCVQNEMNTHMLMDPALQKKKPEIYWPMLRDRRKRRQALRHSARAAGRIRRAQPAARLGRRSRPANSARRSCR